MTDTTTSNGWEQRLLDWRHSQKPKLSRQKAAQLLGMTPTQVHNIEHGRALKAGEEEKLFAVLGQQQALPDAPGPAEVPQGPATTPQVPGEATGAAVWPIQPDEEEAAEEATYEPPVVTPDDFVPASEVPESPSEIALEAPAAFPDDGTRRVSNSELATFRRCRRKWWLAFVRRLELAARQVAGPRELGTRIHRALAAWYAPDGAERGDPFAELERTIQEDMALVMHDAIALDELMKEAELARAMLEGYFQWIAEEGIDEGLEIIAPETKLEVDPRFGLETPVHLIGKLDTRLRRRVDGARLFRDFKTVGSLKQPTLHLDPQMLHYHLMEYLEAVIKAAEGAHEFTDGALYTMLRKVKRTAQAKPPFFDQLEVRHNIHELQAYWSRTRGQVRDMLEVERRLAAGEPHHEVVYPTPTRDCSWDCDFFHVCAMLDDGSRVEDFIASNYTVGDPNARYADGVSVVIA